MKISLIPIDGENVAELMPSIDVGSHAKAEHYGIFAVENQSSIYDIYEKVDVGRIGEISNHGFKHLPHQFHPAQFVHEIKCTQFLLILRN